MEVVAARIFPICIRLQYWTNSSFGGLLLHKNYGPKWKAPYSPLRNVLLATKADLPCRSPPYPTVQAALAIWQMANVHTASLVTNHSIPVPIKALKTLIPYVDLCPWIS